MAWITIKKACEYTGLSYNTIRDIIKEGNVRIGRHKRKILIDKESLDNYLCRDEINAIEFAKKLR